MSTSSVKGYLTDEMSNTNCLKGMRCPNEDCKSYGPYRIVATATVEMWDDGADDVAGFDWEDTAYCQCVLCSYEGSVFNFKEKKDGE